MVEKVPVIAIDGAAAVGKGTVARGVAEKLGYAHLDSGRFYRAVAYLALGAGVDMEDPEAVLAAAKRTIDDPVELGTLVSSSGLDGEETGDAASRVSVHPEVREVLLLPLRSFRKSPGIVADGRDMGTIVFPDAILKVFLVASDEQREERLKERTGKAGDDSRIRGFLERFRERDARDKARRIAPVEPAQDAKVVCTDGMSAAESVAKVVGLYRGLSKGGPNGPR